MLSQQESKIKVEKISKLLGVGKYRLYFKYKYYDNYHDYEIEVLEVRMAFAYEVKDLIDKRVNGDRSYTPKVMLVSTDSGNLFFIIEDIEEYVLDLNGFHLHMGNMVISFMGV